MESHDEERLVYKCLQYGKTEGSYSTKDLNTALKRVELSSVFFLPLQGPKMIWQFGELGYDYSISTCENPNQLSDNCRLTPKPVMWSYFDNTNRKDLYKVMGRMNFLKKNYEEFSSASSFTGNLTGEVKWYKLSSGDNHVVAAGNFATSAKIVSIDFPVTGTWFDYFPGSTLTISTATQDILLAAGEYKLFTTRKMADPFSSTYISPGTGNADWIVLYPNPAAGQVTISSGKPFQMIEIRNISGQVVFKKEYAGDREAVISLRNKAPGLYLVQIISENNRITQKLTLQ